MPPKRLLILDMDNTLYDWRAHFCALFEPLVTALSELVEESATLLKQQFRAIHQQEGHMECASVVRRLPTLRASAKGARARRFEVDSVVQAVMDLSRSKLHAYPGVRQTLASLAGAGWEVVVFTESPARPAAERLHELNLAELVSVVYGGHIPRSRAAPLRMRTVSLPSLVKPAPDALHRILRRHDAPASLALYVGDSISRDVSMARAAGVTGVWARYGSHILEEHRHTLSEASCWGDDKVHRELGSTRGGDGRPDHVIDSFSELAGIAGALGPGLRSSPAKGGRGSRSLSVSSAVTGKVR
jgi:phosphoglycolate phosphatase-like HAD superfamily hydrolase